MLNATNNLSLTTSGTGLLRATGPLNLQGSVINMNYTRREEFYVIVC